MTATATTPMDIGYTGSYSPLYLMVQISYGDGWTPGDGADAKVNGPLGIMLVDQFAPGWSLTVDADYIASLNLADNEISTYAFTVTVEHDLFGDILYFVDLDLNNHGFSSVFEADEISNAAYGTSSGDLILGSTGDDFLASYGGEDRIYGGAGNDQILGGADADVLFGEAGDDQFQFDANDTVDGGTGIDTMLFQSLAEWEAARDSGYGNISNVERATWYAVDAQSIFDPGQTAEQTVYVDMTTGLTQSIFETLADGRQVQIVAAPDDGGAPRWTQTVFGVEGDPLSETQLTNDPLGGGPTTIVDVTLDETGTKKWSSIEKTYDTGSGALIAQHTVFDDGATRTRQFEDGQSVALHETDGSGDKYDWRSRTTTWDADGNRVDRTTVSDSGSRIIEKFDAGTGKRIVREVHDDGDAHSWLFQRTTWDSTGKIKLEDVYQRDDGIKTTTEFSNGVQVSTLTEDTENIHGWSSRLERYDELTSVLTERTITHDDGLIRTKTFDSATGARLANIQKDGADVFDWDTQEHVFTDTGALSHLNMTMDNGDLIERVFQDKSLYTVTTWDFSDSRDWHFERVFYDADGNVTDTDYLFDADLAMI